MFDSDHLATMVKAAVDRFNAMPPAEQAAMRRAQRKSWVVGEMMLEHPDMTRDEVERLYDGLGV